MTDEQINKEIADLCGVMPLLVEWWAYKEDSSGGSICFQAEFKDQVEKWLADLPEGSWAKDYKPKPYYKYPNYCEDLNAMREAEAVLKDKEPREYAFRLLCQLCDGAATDLSEHFDLIHASARQKAKAFLKALGKWKE